MEFIEDIKAMYTVLNSKKKKTVFWCISDVETGQLT